MRKSSKNHYYVNGKRVNQEDLQQRTGFEPKEFQDLFSNVFSNNCITSKTTSYAN